MKKNQPIINELVLKEDAITGTGRLTPKLIGAIADEVSRTLMTRLPHMLTRPKKKAQPKKTTKIENAIFLDTSAIIDGRIFDVIDMGLLYGVVVIPAGILLELKHLADSQDAVKRERGRRGLDDLEKLKKNKKMKVIVLPSSTTIIVPSSK